jgi:DNA modification methylase
MSRVETIGNVATLCLGDCKDILPTLDPVDAIITSPPYAQQRDYGKRIESWGDLMAPLAMVPAHETTQVFINLGLVHRDGEVWEYWEPFKRAMGAAGWRFFGWYVWDQGDGLPGNWNGRLAPCHEFIFHFNKAPIQPAKWLPTKFRRDPGGGLRKPDGTIEPLSSPDKSRQPFKIPDSVIRIYREMNRTGIEAKHPAIYPVALPEYIARTFTQEGQIILDPFMGSGTTGVAAIKLGRQFVGIEIEPKYFEIARKRIESASRQPDMFIKPPPPKQEAMDL